MSIREGRVKASVFLYGNIKLRYHSRSLTTTVRQIYALFLIMQLVSHFFSGFVKFVTKKVWSTSSGKDNKMLHICVKVLGISERIFIALLVITHLIHRVQGENPLHWIQTASHLFEGLHLYIAAAMLLLRIAFSIKTLWIIRYDFYRLWRKICSVYARVKNFG